MDAGGNELRHVQLPYYTELRHATQSLTGASVKCMFLQCVVNISDSRISKLTVTDEDNNMLQQLI